MRRPKLPTVVVVLLFVAACATAPARADSIAADPALLERCIATANGEDAALQMCRGVVARRCMEVEGPSTMSAVLCWSAEVDAWHGAIDAAVEGLNATQTARDPQRLAAANAAWSAWAEAECDYWAWEEGGGSGEQVDRVECAARVAADRAIALIQAHSY